MIAERFQENPPQFHIDPHSIETLDQLVEELNRAFNMHGTSEGSVRVEHLDGKAVNAKKIDADDAEEGQVLEAKKDGSTAWADNAASATAMKDGSETNPGFVFENDTDTGFYRPSSDQIAISVNGREYFRIRDDTNTVVVNEDHDATTFRYEGPNNIPGLVLDDGEVQVHNLFVLKDASADPSNNGEFRRNGSDVKVQSGGALRNLSNVGGSGGGAVWSQTTKTSDYTASSGDSVWVDASSSAVTVTLPSPSKDKKVRVIAVDATNTVKLKRNGSEKINGLAADITLKQDEALTLESDGTNWRII